MKKTSPSPCGRSGTVLQSAVPGGICRQCTDCGLQAVHCSRSDHFCRQKDGADGLGPNARRQKISQQVYLQQYERPGKGYIIDSKSGRLHCLQKVLLRK